MSERAPDESPSKPANRGGSLELLLGTGLLLGSERSLDSISELVLDRGLRLCGAEAGLFVYTKAQGDAGLEPAWRLTAASSLGLETLATPQSAPRLMEALSQAGPVRSPDLRSDERFAPGERLAVLAPRGGKMRSFLGVPVRSPGGEIAGALVYGHAEPGRFDSSSEFLLVGLASQVENALENSRLAEALSLETSRTRAAREEQQKTAERLREALEAGQLGSWTWNKATDLLDLDQRAADLLGAPAHTPVPRTELRERIVFRADAGRTPADLGEVLRSSTPYNAEYRVDRGDQQPLWISSRGLPTFDSATGEIQGMTGTVQDISARKAQEEALLQSEKLATTGRLAATIAHEINNPLELITNLIYIAKTDPSVNAYVRGLLETADSELIRVAQIAQQTLGFYRDTTHPAHVDLSEVLHGVVTLFSRKLTHKKLECRLDLGPDIHIFGLQGEMRQVFANLLVNAIDASSAGIIRVRARRGKRRGTHGVSVLIADPGSGIPHHVRSRLFTPFFTTKDAHGTGLGLWVTRGMVQKHGGWVGFRSCTDEPSGTVFRVFLPSEAHQSASFFAPQSSFVH